jgi:hypothetical protein
MFLNRPRQISDSIRIAAIYLLHGNNLDIELCGRPKEECLQGFVCFRSRSWQVTHTCVLKMRSIENSDRCSFSRQTNRCQDFDVFVTLDPAHLAQGIGQIAIAGNTSGGTFSCMFNVFFEADFLPVAQGQKFSVFSELMFSQSGASWTSTPASGTYFVIGPYGSQSANVHTGLPPGEVDFFPVGTFTLAVQGGGGQHVVRVAPTPEPASMFLFGSAAIGALAKLRLRRRLSL